MESQHQMTAGLDDMQHTDGMHANNHGHNSHGQSPHSETIHNEHASLQKVVTDLYSLEGSALQNAAGSNARVVEAIQSGDWTDPATWGGEVPGPNALVLIPENTAVVYDVAPGSAEDVSVFSVLVEGALDFATDQDTRLEVDTLITDMGSRFTIGTEEDPLPSEFQAEIVIRDDTAPADQRPWDPGQITKGVVSMGEVSVVGADKTTKLTLADDAAAGDTSLVLEGEAEGWEIGDKLVLQGTYFDASGDQSKNTVFHDEELSIENISLRADGLVEIEFLNLATGSSELSFDHTKPSGTDVNIHVANLSRNISFKSEAGEGALPENGGDVHDRGHVMFMHNNDVEVRDAAFVDLGRTDKSELADELNVKGRYSLHFHRAGAEDITEDPAIADGVVVEGSSGWGIAHHQSHLNILDSVVFETVGAGIAAEAGDEIGIWRDNLVLKVTSQATPVGDSNENVDFWRPGSDILRGDVEDRTTQFDFGFAEAYWVQGAGLVSIVDNVAGSAPTAITFFGDSWELVNKDATTVAVGNLRVRNEDGSITETEAYTALRDAGYEDGDRLPVGAVPPKGIQGFEGANVKNGVVFWLTQRNPDGDADINPVYTEGDYGGHAIEHDARVDVSDLSLWGITENGILIQDSSNIDLMNVDIHADGDLARETGAFSLSDVTGVAIGEAGSTGINVTNVTTSGFAEDLTRLSFGPDFTEREYVGTESNDVLITGKTDDANHYLSGGDGNDHLRSYDGNDVLYGGAGDDVLQGSTENGKTGLQNHAMRGIDRDVLLGGDGDDTIVVNGENAWVDYVHGGRGFDTLHMGGGGIYGAAFNRFSAYEQSIEAIGPVQGDPFWQFTGTDTADHIDLSGAVLGAMTPFRALGGDDLYRGVEQDEAVLGGAGNDWISGMGGSDHLVGGEGNDILRGDAGRNYLEGGTGRDTFQAQDEGIQIIMDFDASQDKIQIAASGLTSVADLKAVTLLWNPENEKRDYESSKNGDEEALYITWGENDLPAEGAFVTPADIVGTGILVRGVNSLEDISDRLEIVEHLHSPEMDFTHPIWVPDFPDEIRPEDLSAGLDPARLVEDIEGPTPEDFGLENTDGYAVVRASDAEIDAYSSRHTSLDRAIGSRGKDLYGIGDDENNMILGGEGDDVLVGGDGNDVLEMLIGSDAAFGGAGDDIIRFGPRINSLSTAETERDFDNPDLIYGGSGYDVLAASRGVGLQDFSRKENSIEELWVGKGNIVGSDGPSGDDNSLDFRGVNIKGTSGKSYYEEGDLMIDGRSGDDIIYGSDNAAHILGGTGDDFLAAGSGNDFVDGGSGNDILRGGAGRNALEGGGGQDTFQAGAEGEVTLIADFELGVDSLAVSGEIASVEDIVYVGSEKRAPEIQSTKLTLANNAEVILKGVKAEDFGQVDVVVTDRFDEMLETNDWSALDDPALRGDRIVRAEHDHDPANGHNTESDPMTGPHSHHDMQDPDPMSGSESAPAPEPIDPIPPNLPPTVMDVTIEVEEASRNIALLSADEIASDPDNPNELFFLEVNGAENGTAPLGGDGSTLNYFPNPDFVGTETLSISVWDGEDPSSVGMGTLTINVVAQEPSDPVDQPLVSLLLVDVESGEVINSLEEGDQLDPAFIGNNGFTIVADIDGEVGSVRFNIGEFSNVENSAPYALFGDKNGAFKAGKDALFDSAGDYAVSVELFGGRKASGEKLGEVEVAFSVSIPGEQQAPTLPDVSEPMVPHMEEELEDNSSENDPSQTEEPASPNDQSPPVDMGDPTNGDFLFLDQFQRMAVSADGQGDPDDIGATPAKLAMLAHAGLQDRLVHYHVNSRVELKDEDEMLTSLFEGGELMGFDPATLFSASTDYREAGNSDDNATSRHLAEQINASSAEDQLLVVAAGPWEVIYQALDLADPSKQQFVTVLTHSAVNDANALRNGEGRTRDDVESDFGDIGVIDIRDQNKFFSTRGGNGFSDWNEWKDSDNENLKFVYDRMEVSGKPDISDAGMVFYSLTYPETGEEQPTRDVLFDFFNKPFVTTATDEPETQPEPDQNDDQPSEVIEIIEGPGLLEFETWIQGSDAGETLFGTSESDVLFGGDGEDRLIGGKGDDLFIANTEDVIVKGGKGDDLLYLDKAGTYEFVEQGNDKFVLRDAQDEELSLSSIEALWLKDGQTLEITDGLKISVEEDDEEISEFLF